MALGPVNDSKKSTKTFIYALGLGSNLGDMHKTLKDAKNQMVHAGLSMKYESPLYGTQPVGEVADRVFLNQLILMESDKEPSQLLELIHKVEISLGRVRSVRWENRLIDIDIIDAWFEGKPHKVELPDLVIPHPAIKDRWFLYLPLHNAQRFLYSRLLKS